MNIVEELRLREKNKTLSGVKRKEHSKETIRRTRLTFHQLFEGIQDAIYVIDSDGRILESNKIGYECLDYSKEELLGKNIVEVDETDWKANEFEKVKILNLVGNVCFDSVYVTKNGKRIPVEINARLIESGNEKIILSVARDISYRKAAEQKLKQNEMKFRSFFENNALGTVIMINLHQPSLINQTFADMLGYTKKELESMSTIEMLKLITHPEDFKTDLAYVDKIRSRVCSAYRIEKRFIRKEGQILYADVSTKVLFDDSSQDYIAFSIVLDITEKKKIERSLKENEEKFRSILSNSPGVFYRCANDETYTMEYISEEIERISGYPTTDFIHNSIRSYASLIYPDDKKIVDEAIEQAISINEPYKIKYRIIDKEGTIRWVFERGRGVFDESGRFQWLDGFIFDITHQKEMEETIHRVNEILTRSQLVSFVWINEEGWPVDFVSDNVEKIFGYTKDDLLSGLVNYSDLIYEEDLCRVGEEVRNYLADTTLSEFSQQYRIRSKNGIVHWIEDKTIIRRDEQGNATHLEGIVYEITDRKNAEDLLKENERKYRLLFEESNDAVIIHDLDGNIIDVNEKTCQLLDYSKDRLQKMSIAQIHPDYALEDSKKAFEEIKKQGNVRFDSKVQRRDLTLIDVEISSRIIDENKRIVQGIVRDISKRKADEQKILEKNKELQVTTKRLEYLTDDMEKTLAELDQIFNNRSTAMVVLDENFRILRINDTYADLFDVYKPKALGKKCSEVLQLPYCNTQCFKKGCPIKKELQQKESFEFEEKLKHKDGSYSIYVITASQYYGIDRSTQGIILSYNDVTQIRLNQDELQEINQELLDTREETEDYVALLQEKTAALELSNEKLYHSEEKIRKQNVKLQKLDELKSNFLNVTSHELRTPMSSIKGYAQMMSNDTLGKVNEEQQKALEVMLRNINRLDTLIQDILDISRLESGTLKFIPENTDIADLLGDIKETMYSAAKEKNIDLNIELYDTLPNLDIDKERIKQVLMNLINNAVKFSEEKTQITIKGFIKDDDVVIQVKDQGRGIPKDKQEHVFETFYQVDSGMDRKFGGAGLGLAISRGIVIAHGGSIWLESEGVPGEGTTFTFTLPRKSVESLEERFKKIDVFKLDSANQTVI